MNILLLASHAVAEYDDLRMFTDLGYDGFCPGGYQDPRNPSEPTRPGIPEAPYHPELIEACERIRHEKGDPGEMIDWAKASLPAEVIDWADVIIAHHFVDRWIGHQWDRIRHKRVIWRTCGQSNHFLERFMAPYVADGLQVVRYSPKERAIPYFAGETALIRFGKYPDDYGPWMGDRMVVGNVTQHLMARGAATNGPFWMSATHGLPRQPAGPGSEQIGGLGPLSYPDMLDYLRHIRAYLYTGTQPASYTLGLIEAMLTGVPVVSIGADWHSGLPYGPRLFEGVEIVGMIPNQPDEFSRPDKVRRLLAELLHSNLAEQISPNQVERARDLFDVARIGPQWQAFLDHNEAPVEVAEMPVVLPTVAQ